MKSDLKNMKLKREDIFEQREKEAKKIQVKNEKRRLDT